MLLTTFYRDSGWTPAQLFPANTGAWHTAYDRNYMAVNSDGTGGIPAAGSQFGRLIDRSGGGFHMVNSTSASQPYAESGWAAFGFGNSSRHFINTPDASFGGTTQNATGLLIVDVASFPVDSIPFTFTNSSVTGAAFPGRNLALAWRCKATGYEFWLNNVQITASALTSTALSALFLGASATNTNTIMRFYESVLIASALSDANFALLRAYGLSRAGASSFDSTGLIAYGDSRTFGTDSIAVTPWINLTNLLPNAVKFNLGVGGGTIGAPTTTAAVMLSKYKQSGITAVGVWIGRNDIDVSGSSAATTYAALSAYCKTLFDGGMRVAVATEVALTNNSIGVAYSDLIRAGWSGNFAHAIADLYADTRLQNRLDTTYFADGTHMTDAGNAVVESIMTPALTLAIAGPNPLFTGSPLSGVIPLSVTFTDQSTQTPTSWLWDFGDGNTSTSQNPTHSYAVAGNYDVTLTATNASGSHVRKKAAYIAATAALAPTSTGMVGWYKKGTASGANWADASGAGNDLALVGSPTINGSGSVTFNGTSQYGRTANYTLNATMTTYLRAKVISYVNGNAVIDGNTQLSALLYMSGTSPQLSYFPANGPFATNSDMTVGTMHSIAAGQHPDSTHWFVQVSGSAETTGVGGVGGSGNTPNGFTLAASGDTISRFCNIEVLEVLRYNVDHSPTDRATNLAYLDSL